MKKTMHDVPASTWLVDILSPAELEASRLRAQVMMHLQDFRREQGYTQQQLAELLGITQALVSRWENGEENFTLATLAKIALVTNNTIDLSFTKKVA